MSKFYVKVTSYNYRVEVFNLFLISHFFQSISYCEFDFSFTSFGMLSGPAYYFENVESAFIFWMRQNMGFHLRYSIIYGFEGFFTKLAMKV